MQTANRIVALFTLTLLVVALSGGPASGDIETYMAVLNGDNNVPVVDTPATGTAELVVDTDTREAAWFLQFTGLTSAQIAAHFHNAPEGVNGTAVHTLPVGSPIAGVWNMSPAHYGELANENIYVNIHTQNNPLGEIRGQMNLVGTVPNHGVAFGAVKALYR